MQKYSQGQLKHGLQGLVHKLKRRFREMNKAQLIKNLVLGGLAVFLFGVVVLGGLFAWYAKDLPNPNGLATREVSQSTKIYDRTGTHLLYQIALNGKRTLVTLDQVPASVKNATITAEDRAFYEHGGFTLKGIARAILFAGKRGGGSTITQQLVKNAILTNEKKISRKLKEIILSIEIEQIYSKDQILQMYLNEISYGSANYGIEAASEQYFGKPAKDLDLAQSATLAAIPQRPNTYVNNPDLLKERRDWILNGMVDEGYVTREEADAALKEDTQLTTNVSNLTVAPHFVLWVKGLLEDTYSTKLVETGGLKVITTIDYDKQVLAEKAVKDGVDANGKRYNFTDAGLLSVDPKTGQILAMVGSPDYRNNDIDGQVNVTTQPLQPGSSIKPIVYAAAFEKGYTPSTLLWDDRTTFPTPQGPYTPTNYDSHEQEHGLVTMRQALQGSLNIPAVKTLYLVGIDSAIRFAERLGYSTLDPSKIGLSMVLGGVQVTMLDHAAAYAVFANGGTYRAPTGILRVENPDGSVLEEWKADEHQGERVIDSNLAAVMDNVLSDNDARAYVFGTNNWLVLPGRPSAAKTGTTNAFKDAWTMGYTPSLVTGVWVGNANGTTMKSGADGSQVAAPIWNAYMKGALNGTPVEAFPKADLPVTGKDALDGKVPGTSVTIDTASGKLATELTPDRLKKEVVCGEYHDILQYVNKDHPLDPAPEHPEKDPNYSVWEAALQDYITRHNASLKDGEKPLENCKAPTEYDDVHTLENKPSIGMSFPVNNFSVGRTFNTQISVGMRRSFSRVEYAVDGVYIATSFSTNGASITLPGWVSQGSHSFTATVYDDVDNSAFATAIINVTEAGSKGGFTITNPFNSQTIERAGAPYTVVVEVPHSSDYSSLTLTARNLFTGSTVQVGSIASPPPIASISWNLPEAGDYTLEAEATSTTGQVLESTPVKVYVRDPAQSTAITP